MIFNTSLVPPLALSEWCPAHHLCHHLLCQSDVQNSTYTTPCPVVVIPPLSLSWWYHPLPCHSDSPLGQSLYVQNSTYTTPCPVIVIPHLGQSQWCLEQHLHYLLSCHGDTTPLRYHSDTTPCPLSWWHHPLSCHGDITPCPVILIPPLGQS